MSLQAEFRSDRMAIEVRDRWDGDGALWKTPVWWVRQRIQEVEAKHEEILTDREIFFRKDMPKPIPLLDAARQSPPPRIQQGATFGVVLVLGIVAAWLGYPELRTFRISKPSEASIQIGARPEWRGFKDRFGTTSTPPLNRIPLNDQLSRSPLAN